MSHVKICALLVLSICAWCVTTPTTARAAPSATTAADPEPIFADGFEDPPPLNEPPQVDAGADQTITLPASASLLGSVSDDGLPAPPGAVVIGWSKFSGPGSVAFGNPATATTSATFSVDGACVLRLTAHDGALAAFDDVQITVNPQGPPVFEPSEVDPTAATLLFDSTQFLYTGLNPVQTGVAPGTITAERGSVVRGRVFDRDGLPLAVVTVAIHERPEFGQTQTRDDGGFDLAVNGGGLFTGMHFGFPHCHGGDVPDPDFAAGRKCGEFTPPAQKFGAHVASLGRRFYTGAMFPPEYRHQAFIAEHGSWNRSRKSGYRVMRAKVEGGKVIEYGVFAEGFLDAAVDRAWGRPVDVQVMPDGALLVSDDYANAIYRIAWRGP